ncbi:ATPase [Undibacterium sp. Jales W-56]|uniref:BadF/BadG/BcrA/BcrD ATPase family protein n=1 Tax=Undibacterium sp. Jales W-56 TaxID=2897325 RepID=UPI0021D1D0A6|nr:BadF/BadG/BcrA/BcrD ATPase family protein [Undibacterium sp. Jales W-56]MCU6435565.1 ATPase [Undibacterium sp. Jales W-56]
MSKQYQYLIGVDGGGTGTRVRLVCQGLNQAHRAGGVSAVGAAGPSGLMHGAAAAWDSILTATAQAFAEAGLSMPALNEIAAGCGLAGVNNRAWAAEFVAANPGFGVLAIETDAGTTLLGAHQGKAGVIIALGTGSVGEVMLADGTRREVGGWGFPSSDEASGAWLGLRAINHAQHVLDGRSPADALSAALIAHCGGDKDAVFGWLAQANQTRYAQLAPMVVAQAGTVASASTIMLAAGREVAKMALALDPSGTLPIALCGGLAEPMAEFLPPELNSRIVKPHADSAAGALILIQHRLLSIS